MATAARGVLSQGGGDPGWGKHSAAQGAGSARRPRAARGRPRLCWPCSAAKGRCGRL